MNDRVEKISKIVARVSKITQKNIKIKCNNCMYTITADSIYCPYCLKNLKD